MVQTACLVAPGAGRPGDGCEPTGSLSLPLRLSAPSVSSLGSQAGCGSGWAADGREAQQRAQSEPRWSHGSLAVVQQEDTEAGTLLLWLSLPEPGGRAPGGGDSGHVSGHLAGPGWATELPVRVREGPGSSWSSVPMSKCGVGSVPSLTEV